MEIELFAKELKDKASQIDIILEEKQIENFYTYMNLLLEWNQKINLTAITEPNEVILKHFVVQILMGMLSFPLLLNTLLLAFFYLIMHLENQL